MNVRRLYAFEALLVCAPLVLDAAEVTVTAGHSSGPDVYSGVASVLRVQGFNPPVFFPGTNGDAWLTCDRPVGDSQFDRVLVCVRPRGQVIVQIQHYRFAIRSWHVSRAELYECGRGGRESDALLAARLWFPGPVKSDGFMPWHLRGTNLASAAESQGMRERAFQRVGYALAEESAETEEGLPARLSGNRYVGDPVSSVGLEAAAVGRAIWDRLWKPSPAGHGER